MRERPELIALANALALALTERPAEKVEGWVEAARPILTKLHATGWTIRPDRTQEAQAHG